MKTILYTEPNEWPTDVIAHGTYPATWGRFTLLLTGTLTRVQTSHGFPGAVACEVTFTAETVTVAVELES